MTFAPGKGIPFRPDTLRNSLSVDAVLWKGSRDATTVQRVGIAIFGLAYFTAGLSFAYMAYSRHSAVIGIFSIPLILLGLRVFWNTFRR